jgi:hypothetical protein
MNEFDQERDFRKQFLRAAYELCPDRKIGLSGFMKLLRNLDWTLNQKATLES